MKLIIFDMDGVLVDACEWHRIALNHALLQISNYEIPAKDHIKKFNGIPTRSKLQILLEMGAIKFEDIKKIEDLKQEKTLLAIENYASYDEQKVKMMKEIRSQGIKIACYTNSVRMTAEAMLRKTGLLDYIDLLITNQDVKKHKPDPEGYNFCIDKFGLEKNKCAIIEDSEVGIEAARKSGANVFTVNGPQDVSIDLIRRILHESFDPDGG